MILNNLIMLGVLYILICAVFAVIGSDKTIGYWGSFFICLFYTPIVGILVIVISPNKSDTVLREYRCKNCDYSFKTYEIKVHYCPRCGRDHEGFTQEENVKDFIKRGKLD